MLRQSTPAELQAAIAVTLRQQLRLDLFADLEPEKKRMHLESAQSFLRHPDALRTDKRAVMTFLEVLATDAEEAVRAIAQGIVDNWNNPL